MSTATPCESEIFEHSFEPHEDRSEPIYYSDGTVSTVDRERQMYQLLEERQRIINVDPVRAAGWFNALVIVQTVTPAEVIAALNESLASINAEIQAKMPTPSDAVK